jgi:predicted nuclease with RNAse H fold
MRVVGIDLAGVEDRKTGNCVLDLELRATTRVLHTDEEVIGACLDARLRAVAIDAPLALPKGRESLEERSYVHMRTCDRELLRMRIKFFPVTLGPMRKLTKRGIGLRKKLEERGIDIVEVYPGAAQDLLKIPRKQKGLEKLREGLEGVGISGLSDEMNVQELDAVTSALVGKMYVEGNYLSIGDPEEVLMILPKPV